MAGRINIHGKRIIVRNEQVSWTGDYVKMKDCLGQTRWFAIKKLRMEQERVIGTLLGQDQEIVISNSSFIKEKP